jgi:Zn-dependent peptidase ImmA (M78 family)
MMTTNPKGIQQKADAVLQSHGIIAPFVNAFDVAAREGIAVKLRIFPSDKPISGFYYDPGKTIYVNSQEPPQRQLFTVAHELGHYFLEHQPNSDGKHERASGLVKPTSYSTSEADADFFAANLLMPEKLVRAEVKKFPYAVDLPSLLAMRFGVSPSAMIRRLKYLNLT